MKALNSIFTEKLLGRLELIGYAIFLGSLVMALRPVNTIAIIYLVLLGTISRVSGAGSGVTDKRVLLFAAGCIGFYVLYLFSLLYTSNYPVTFKHLLAKLSLVFIPVFLLLHKPTDAVLQKAAKIYVWILLLAVGICLTFAVKRFMTDETHEVFFYHSLVSPLRQHAVLFSMLVLFGLSELVTMLFRKEYFLSFWWHISSLILLGVFLFLLSSKLMITLFVLFVLFNTLFRVQKKWISWVISAGGFLTILLISLTQNPLSDRFSEIIRGDLGMINQSRFNQGTYFNGLQFRLLQWKNVGEILDESHAWLLGVSPGNAQQKLNEKYISKDMYSGTEERGETGFLGYNTHNQFLESILQLGIIGEFIFLISVFGMILLAFLSRSSQTAFAVVVILAFSITEAVLETQFGLVVYTFFPLYFFLKTMPRRSLNVQSEFPG